MKNELSRENLNKLFSAIHDDAETIEIVLARMKSFEDYHSAIFKMELWMQLYDGKNLSPLECKLNVVELDNSRTHCHNAVLATVNMLNRLAASYEIPPIYDGTVSEEQPYRRQVADAVLAYCESLVAKRI